MDSVVMMSAIAAKETTAADRFMLITVTEIGAREGLLTSTQTGH